VGEVPVCCSRHIKGCYVTRETRFHHAFDDVASNSCQALTQGTGDAVSVGGAAGPAPEHGAPVRVHRGRRGAGARRRAQRRRPPHAVHFSTSAIRRSLFSSTEPLCHSSHRQSTVLFPCLAQCQLFRFFPGSTGSHPALYLEGRRRSRWLYTITLLFSQHVFNVI